MWNDVFYQAKIVLSNDLYRVIHDRVMITITQTMAVPRRTKNAILRAQQREKY